MRFEMRCLGEGGEITTIVQEASNMEAAQSQARQQGYRVLKTTVRREWGGFRWGGAQKFPLGQFSQELLTLLEAGLSIVESIETLKEKEGRAEHQRLLGLIVDALYEGQSFSQALEGFPQTFTPLYVATIRASERTGDLPESLSRYVAYQAQLDIVRKKIVAAAIYPVLLAAVGSLVIVFLLVYVVPRFARIFEDMGGRVPFMSQLLIRWGALVHDHGWLMLFGMTAFCTLMGFWLTRPSVQRAIFDWVSSLPAIGERFRMYELARFYRTVGMLLRGGMPIMVSLVMTGDLLRGPLRQRLSTASASVREGVPLSVAMAASGLTTPVSLRMLRVGERTGQMGEMMERIARFYDDEVARWVEWFVRLFEPLLMAFIGLAIGVIVVLMYFPIFELAGSIQ
ncbi:type II secretion system F family protein [Dechloromonas sp. HYN0024]|uniref:type II secretion system F family protein n=1 Tax=Dechloromonas sp. HYN0024 TaxID=2231055 RepID=UPI000E4303C7|nr:type II secretion system F family protein [Dechloromonas sp. HYN0024]AXS81046.1 type II secretion system F family protein [Dechloromonas sp. HYN0024]